MSTARKGAEGIKKVDKESSQLEPASIERLNFEVISDQLGSSSVASGCEMTIFRSNLLCRGESDEEPEDRALAFSSLALSQEATDALYARDMNGLSMEEREQVLHDVHGIVNVTVEDPIFICSKLVKLEQEINQITAKEAFEKAQSLSIFHVNDPKLRLKFLRADLFDCKLAAARIVEFFKLSLALSQALNSSRFSSPSIVRGSTSIGIPNVKRSYWHSI